MADSKSNEVNVDKASHIMDLQSRTIAALGADTFKNLSSLEVLIIGLRGVGVETAKNLILTGPKSVTLYDDSKVEIRDLGANFYLREEHVGQCTRSEGCTKTLAELNPYCDVRAASGALSDEFIQSFGAVVVTQTLPQKELNRINNLCRTRPKQAAVFILAVTHGITAHFFSDFGPSHVVKDADGEPARALVIDDLSEDGVVTVAAKRHGFDDGDTVLIEEIEGVKDIKDGQVDIEALNNLAGVRVKRIYIKYESTRADGTKEKREKQVFTKFQLDLSETELAGKTLSAWKTGGIINEIKPKKEYKFRSFSDCQLVPATEGLAAFFGPQHPDQGAWEQGAGKTIHLLYASALQFNDKFGRFMGLHDEEDQREFVKIFKEINKRNKESGKEGACFIEEPFNLNDIRRMNAYSWYFQAELTGYCAFLGGVAAQEVVKKFGKYTPIFQWLHSDHSQFIGNEVPSDAVPVGCRYDDQISIFGQAFQRKLGSQTIFLVGTGALGCEYLKGLALMGVCCGVGGKLTCTDMDRIEISNLSRQFLFRARHVGQPKSTTAAAVAKDMNASFNVEALEMKVWPETEDHFDDEFWDNLDLCWNALDNVHARKYTDNKCLLHSKPLLESGTQGTKCNSEVIIPFKTKSYNDGEEQETEGIPMCTLQNFPYLPVHCIEWSRASFSRFETEPKLYNTFMKSTAKFLEQVETAEGDERHSICKTMEALIAINQTKLYDECIRLSFDEFVRQHVTRIKNLTHLFPENEMTKDKSGAITGRFWTGHKKFPQIPAFDGSKPDANPSIVDYLYASAQLYAFTFGVKSEQQPKDRSAFVECLRKLNLAYPEWVPPTNLKIKVDEDDDDAEEDEKDTTDEEKEKEIGEILSRLKSLDKSKFIAQFNETEFEKDDDANFHIDFITAAANARAHNFRIKQTSRHQCKIIAGKIIAALATTTAMICGLIELEFIKLKLGLGYVHQDAFYNANINLAVAQFQFFQPDAANRNEIKTVFDPVMYCDEKHVPYPPLHTSWHHLIVDEGDLTIKQFVDAFPKLFNKITIELLHKKGKMEKGILLFNEATDPKKDDKMKANLIAKYIDAYGPLVSDKRKYVILGGSFRTKDGDVAVIPSIKYYFK